MAFLPVGRRTKIYLTQSTNLADNETNVENTVTLTLNNEQIKKKMVQLGKRDDCYALETNSGMGPFLRISIVKLQLLRCPLASTRDYAPPNTRQSRRAPSQRWFASRVHRPTPPRQPQLV